MDNPMRLLEIRVLKLCLAEIYIWENPKEKAYFLRTSDKDIQHWGAYIAGLVLTKRGILHFRSSDIKSILKSDLAKDIYGGVYAADTRVMPADISWNSKQTGQGFIDIVFPALQIVDPSKPKNDFEYEFLGYERALQKKFEKFKAGSIKDALAGYHRGVV